MVTAAHCIVQGDTNSPEIDAVDADEITVDFIYILLKTKILINLYSGEVRLL